MMILICSVSKKDGNLKKGSDLSKVFGNSRFVLATSDAHSTWKIGDTVRLGGGKTYDSRTAEK